MHPAEEETYQSFEDLRRPLIPNNNNMGTISDTNNSCDDDDDDDAGQSPEMLSHPATAAAQSLAWYQNPYQITAMISNFSTSYNVVNISMVLPILEQLETASSEDAAACASSLLAGMIVGQLFGGALGDSRLGRLGALRLVMALQIVASLASAFVGVTQTKQELSHEDIFLRLAALRFFLGIGCGGVYPLAAVLSAEQGKEEESTTAATPHPQQLNNSVRHISKDEGDSVHRVVLTFSTQGMGFIAVPIVAVILLNSTTNMNFIWRAILGLGALPGIVLFLLQCRWSWQRPQRPQLVPTDDPEHDHDHSQTSSPSNQVENAEESEPSAQNEFINEGDGVIAHTTTSEGWFQTLLHEPGLGRKVLGTAGTWFLFDVVFYGNTIFQPIVVEAAFGGTNSNSTGIALLRKTATDSLVLTSIALPGYAVAGAIMGKKTFCVTQSPRYVMLQGFAAMSVLYATIGMNWSYLRGYPTMLVFLYGMTFFFANYGPNTTTFILPSLTFEKKHRSTMNGFSAAAGKMGALTGATLFEPAADTLGDSSVMLICAGVAIFAFFLTACAIPKQTSEPSRSGDVEPTEVSLTAPNGEVV